MAAGKANNTKTTSNKKTGTGAKSKTGTKNTSAKKTTASKAKTSSKVKDTSYIEEDKIKEKYVPTAKEIKLRNEIKLLISLVVTLLLLLSNFGFLSPVGDYLSYFMFGLFGFIAYLFPIVIFLGVAFLISNVNNKRCIRKFITGSILFILIAAVIQLVFMDYDNTKSIFDYYGICGEGKIGGGLFGATVEKMLHSLFGTLGTYIILALLIIIALVLLTEKSFISGVKKGSTAVYETAREDASRIRRTAKSIAEERAYQKKEKRVDNRVHGVNITTVGEGRASEEEDVHEISSEIRNKASESKSSVYNNYRGTDEGIDYNENSDNENADMSSYVNTQSDNGFSYNNYTEVAERNTYDDYEENIERNTYDSGLEELTGRNIYDNDYVEIAGRSTYGDNDINNSKKISSSGDYNRDITDSKENYNGYDNEDGLYTPKEKIEVSGEARSVMSRKAFSVGTSSNSVNRTNTVNVTSEVSAKRKAKDYKLPSTSLLNKSDAKSGGNNEKLKAVANRLQEILQTFGVNASVVDFSRGPSVTRYEIQPETGTRLSKITSLADDIKLNMAATDIRIEPIPGKSTIGIEVPNESRDSVLIRELIESKELKQNSSKIAFAAGKDIAGKVIVADIGKMPHMLVAGTTGSGKSVFTNSIIMSILFRAKPTEVRLIIVDPKVVEFGVYNGIPHLLQPVVTDPKLASNTLKWAVNEMSERYKKFADFNVRDLKGYNEKVESAGKETGLTKLPQIVIVIDELADLMMVAAKEVEESICRLAQLARAAGIHLIIATQRPSVDVVTGLIKANIPSRCALMVSSGVDSRTIIDSNGAEKLLGNGDMLFYPSGYVKPVRLQGAFVSDKEVQEVVKFWKSQAGDITYDDTIANYVSSPQIQGDASGGGDRDDYFFEAARFVIEKEKASTSMLQRMFKIGFNRAARIMDQLCEAGVVGDEEGTKPRKVLMTLEDLEELKS